MGWTDTLLTGIDEIDDQHKILFDCLARLQASISADDRWSAVHFALEELSDFVRIHFAVEEALMRMHDYPAFDAHVAEHRYFAKELADLQVRSVRTDVSKEMIDLLNTWLVNHIGKTDQHYVPCLRTASLT